MIPLAIPQMTGREAVYLQDCVDTNFVSSVGPYVDRFEALVAEASGAAKAVATSAGTTGLHAALTAVGVEAGDLVILPSFTFIASANAISNCGAFPWLFDISEANWTLDPVQVKTVLKQKTERVDGVLRHKESGQRVAAMLPVFTLGMAADMDPLIALAREYAIPVVTDSAAALGSRYKGRPSGDLGADLAVYSFNGNKTVTAGGGGAIAGSDTALLDLVRHLTTTARIGPDYTHDRVGFNYRMTNIQAAVGCAQMESLDEFVAKKRRIAQRYDDGLAGQLEMQAFPDPDWSESAKWFTGVLLSAAAAEKLPSIRTALREDGIDARPFWKPVHLQPPYQDCPVEDMARTDDIWSRILTLPCSTSLTDVEQDTVIEAVLRRVKEAQG